MQSKQLINSGILMMTMAWATTASAKDVTRQPAMMVQVKVVAVEKQTVKAQLSSGRIVELDRKAVADIRVDGKLRWYKVDLSQFNNLKPKE